MLINHDDGPWRITSRDAAARLGVKVETVYAYASRGLLHPRRGPGGSTYDPKEIEALASGLRPAPSEPRPGPELMFRTRLTLIEDGRLRYRGDDVDELAGDVPFEEVAWWLWTGAADEVEEPAGRNWSAPAESLAVARLAVGALGGQGLPIDALRVAAAAAATVDPLRFDLSTGAVALTGRTILAAMVDSLPTRDPRPRIPAAGEGPLAQRLWHRLVGTEPTHAEGMFLDAALVLLADHELAPSTLAARVAAAFRADPYAVVGAGLGPASGPLHSGAASEVRALLEAADRDGAAAAVGAVLGRGGPLPGFGHRLYPNGDPRGTMLFPLLDDLSIPAPRRAVLADLLGVVARQSSPPPNVDFPLGCFEWGLDLPAGSGQAVFAVARVAGWIAHAIEEYEARSVFRARAAYVGAR